MYYYGGPSVMGNCWLQLDCLQAYVCSPVPWARGVLEGHTADYTARACLGNGRSIARQSSGRRVMVETIRIHLWLRMLCRAYTLKKLSQIQPFCTPRRETNSATMVTGDSHLPPIFSPIPGQDNVTLYVRDPE